MAGETNNVQISLGGANWIVGGLMLGEYAYIARRPSLNKKREWCIYDGKASPSQYISKKQFLKISVLLKEDKKGNHTVDLRKIRRLHGNDHLKKFYKRFKKQQHAQAE